jgi:hypothetical protein
MSYFSDYFKAAALVNLQIASGGVALADTSISLATGQGANLETLTRSLLNTGINTGGYLMGILWDGLYAGPLQDPNAEPVRIDSHAAASDTIAVVLRGQDGKSAVAHNTAGHTYYLTVVFSPTIQNDLYAKLGYKEAIKQRPMTFTTPYDVSSYVGYPLCNGMPTSTGVAMAKDIIYATRHFFKKGTILYGLKFRCTSSQNNACHFGIWANDYSQNPYPGSLLLDVTHTGTTTTALITESPFPYTVPYDDAFWVGVDLANIVTLGVLDPAYPFDNFLGRQLHSSTVNGVNLGISVASVHGALADPFPAGGALILSSAGSMPFFHFIHQSP